MNEILRGLKERRSCRSYKQTSDLMSRVVNDTRAAQCF